MSEDEPRDLIEICFKVGPHHANWRLDRFVSARIPRLSRGRVQQMLRAQSTLGAQTLRPSMKVREGQMVRLLRPAPDEPEVPLHYQVVYEDEVMLGICKPAGLPVHATARFHRNTLTALLRRQYAGVEPPRLVHRIDRETSGMLLLAHDPQAEARLKGDLARRRVHKSYMAIVFGDPGIEGVIDGPIGPDLDSGIRVKQAVVASGLTARTRFRRIDRRGDFSLVEASPETGRQHQIRVHLSSIGCPIVGDKLYGTDPTCLLEYLETGWTQSLNDRLLLPRHALHAWRISFRHPTTQADTCLECELAADLQAFWDGLGR
jgi:23S rRNA pseudouridine1911/1915/1917 synthase